THAIESRANVWLATGICSAQRSARAPSGAVAKRLDVILRSSTSSTVPISTILPPKLRLKKSLSFFRHASVEIGERIGRDVVGAALKVEGEQTRPLARQPSKAGVGHRLDTAGDQLGRHRRHLLAVDLEPHRHAAGHAVGIGVDVERADVAPESDSGALSGRRQQRTILMLKLAEYDLAGAGAERQRAQVIAVKAAHPGAECLLAERHRGLFDRRRKYDVEADDPGAAVDDRGQHLRDLARPSDGRRAV